MEMNEFFARGKDLAKDIDDNQGQWPNNYTGTQAYSYTPATWVKKSSIKVRVAEPELEKQEDIDQKKDFDAEEYYEYLDGQPELDEQEIIDAAEDGEKTAMHRWKHAHPNSSLKLQRKLFERGVIPQLPWNEYLVAEADIINQDEFKKKDSRLDGDSSGSTDQKEQRDIGYVQNAEQGQETIWQRIKNTNQ